MTKKRKPAWRPGALNNADIVRKMLEGYKAQGSRTCTCPWCVLARRVIRERRGQWNQYNTKEPQ